MKNIKYLALFFSLTLLISCGQDDVDSVNNPGVLTPTSEINVGFIDANDGQFVLESGADPITYTIGINTNPLDVNLQLTLAMTSADGTIDGASFPTSVTIPAGETSVDLEVSFSDDGVDEGFAAETFVLEILDTDFQNSNDYYVTPGEVTRSVDVVDAVPSILTPAGDVQIVLTFASSYDLDIFLVTGNQDLGGGIIDSSQGITSTETVVLPADEIGTFSLYMYEYYFDYPVDYSLTFNFPGGQQETFRGTISEDGFQFTFIKEPFGNQYGYQITQL